MSKKVMLAAVVIIVAVATVFLYTKQEKAPLTSPDEQAVREVVAEFSARLKNSESYKDLISTDLQTAFEKEPVRAPARLDSIEILEVSLTDDGAYEVQGKIIPGKYSMALKLRNREGRWIITGFSSAMPVSDNLININQ